MSHINWEEVSREHWADHLIMLREQGFRMYATEPSPNQMVHQEYDGTAHGKVVYSHGEDGRLKRSYFIRNE